VDYYSSPSGIGGGDLSISGYPMESFGWSFFLIVGVAIAAAIRSKIKFYKHRPATNEI